MEPYRHHIGTIGVDCRASVVVWSNRLDFIGLRYVVDTSSSER